MDLAVNDAVWARRHLSERHPGIVGGDGTVGLGLALFLFFFPLREKHYTILMSIPHVKTHSVLLLTNLSNRMPKSAMTHLHT
jgi:hypothetical protein